MPNQFSSLLCSKEQLCDHMWANETSRCLFAEVQGKQHSPYSSLPSPTLIVDKCAAALFHFWLWGICQENQRHWPWYRLPTKPRPVIIYPLITEKKWIPIFSVYFKSGFPLSFQLKIFLDKKTITRIRDFNKSEGKQMEEDKWHKKTKDAPAQMSTEAKTMRSK